MTAAAPNSSSRFDRAPDRILRDIGPHLSFYGLQKERLYVTEPSGSRARANVVLVHGLTEHAARHFHTARWLAALGCRTIQLDWAGHGGREAPLDASWWIYQAFAQGTTADAVLALLQDHRTRFPDAVQEFSSAQFSTLAQTTMADHFNQIDLVLNELMASAWNASAVPLFLFGHSMGGLLTAETAARWHSRLPNLKGVILSSPAFKPQGRPGAWLENRLIDLLWERRNQSDSLLRRAAKGALDYNLPYDTTWSAPYISDEPIEQELYLADPLVPNAGPSSYASSIEDQMVLTEARAAAFPTHALMVLPGQDGVTSTRGAADFAARAQAGAGKERFALVQYQQCSAHDLLRSLVRRQAQQAIAAWLTQRLAR